MCDGYNSELSKVLIRTEFKIYNLNKNTITNYNQTNQSNPANVRIENALHNLTAYQIYDEFIAVNPQQGTMQITENIGGL